METLVCYRTADGKIHTSFQDAKRYVQRQFDDLVDQLCLNLVTMLKESFVYRPEPALVQQLLKEISPDSQLDPETVNKLSDLLLSLNLSQIMIGKRPLHHWMVDHLTDFETLIDLQEDLNSVRVDDNEYCED